jgi:L-iditol 2-dehydrogenase
VKALVKYAVGPNNMQVMEVAEPSPSSGEVIVGVKACGICGTDLHIQAGEYSAYPPLIMGHEFAGEVIDLGSGVEGVVLGDRVTGLTFTVTCGKCTYCLHGDQGLCPERRSIGSGVDGAFAPYLVMPASMLRLLPQNIDFDDGALLEPLACCVKAILELASIKARDTVLVTGPGSVGLLSLQVARSQGAKVILVGTDGDDHRLAVGRDLGADWVLRAGKDDVTSVVEDLTKGTGADVVLECAGSPSAVDACLRLIRKQGQYVQIGLHGKPFVVDFDLLAFKDVRLIGSFSSSMRSWDRALRLVQDGIVRLRPIISTALPLGEWERGFSMAGAREALKVVIHPGE